MDGDNMNVLNATKQYTERMVEVIVSCQLCFITIKKLGKSTPDSFSMLKLVYSCDYYLNSECKAKLSS